MECAIGGRKHWLFGTRPLQPDITIAVAWRFTQGKIADVVAADQFPALVAFSAGAEALPEFLATPFDG